MKDNGKALMYSIGFILFLMAIAISYYIIFAILIIIAVIMMGKITVVGQNEYKKAQKQDKENYPEVIWKTQKQNDT